MIGPLPSAWTDPRQPGRRAWLSLPTPTPTPEPWAWPEATLLAVVRLVPRAARAIWWAAVIVAAEVVAVAARAMTALAYVSALDPGRRRTTSTWRARPRAVSPAVATFGDANPLARREPGRRRPRLGRIAALVALVLFADLLAGTIVNLADPRADRGVAQSHFFGPATPARPGHEKPAPDDPRAHQPALAGSPWAAAFYREVGGLEYDYQPYVLTRPLDYHGAFLSIEGNARVSWEPPGRHLPVVWFFGGSTMFGDGQRDQHTIASEVARLAAADGHSVLVRNFGIEGFVNFQEVMWLGQQLGAGPPPDLVVFYDGANDTYLHGSQAPTDQPSVLGALSWLPQGSLPTDRSLPAAWAWASLAARVWRGDRVTDPSAVQARAAQMLDVYGRGLALAHDLAAERGARFVSFFQPSRPNAQDPIAHLVRAHVPAGTIDISHALDGPGLATYIDPVHTNELGARLVAEAIYGHLRTTIIRIERRP